MAKRSREDFEPSSPDPSSPGDDTVAAALRVVNPSLASTSTKASKFLQLDLEGGEAPDHYEVASPEMRCSLPPHRQTLSFPSLEDYETHYAKEHTNRCLECRKNFPTTHFLNLHIEENHDSLVGVRRERGEKTYSCFVVDCDRVCSTPQKRRMHLIDKHSFPKEYDFHIVNDGIDHRSSMLRSGRHRRRSSAAIQAESNRRRASTLENGNVTEEGQDARREREGGEEKIGPVEGKPSLLSERDDDDMEDLVGGMSALKFVPPSVRFGRGRGKGRGGFSRT